MSLKVAAAIPAYQAAPSVGAVVQGTLELLPEVLVIDDGSSDATAEEARRAGARVVSFPCNRGKGAALATAFQDLFGRGFDGVITLDADGQHLPSEMERLVKPVLDGEVDMAHGSRVLGHADRNHFARELGIVFFNRLVSFITRTHVTDCSNGYRAVRTTVLPQLVLRQEQFHTSEFMIEAIKRGIPATEVPITVDQRLHGHSKKPAVFRYGMGFANAIVRTSWASGWNLETGKPNLTPEFSDYSTGPKLVFPASAGARNWYPAAYDPGRNTYFASVIDMGNLMFVPPGMENPPHQQRSMNAASLRMGMTTVTSGQFKRVPLFLDDFYTMAQ